MGIWNTLKEWQAFENMGSRRTTKGAPAATAEEDMVRITGRRNIRLVKAISAGVLSAAMIAYPVGKALMNAGEMFGNAVSGKTPAEEMAERDGARPIVKIDQAKPKSFEIDPATLAKAFLLVAGAAVGGYGVYKGRQARADGKYLKSIWGHIDYQAWASGGSKSNELPGTRTECRGFGM